MRPCSAALAIPSPCKSNPDGKTSLLINASLVRLFRGQIASIQNEYVVPKRQVMLEGDNPEHPFVNFLSHRTQHRHRDSLQRHLPVTESSAAGQRSPLWTPGGCPAGCASSGVPGWQLVMTDLLRRGHAQRASPARLRSHHPACGTQQGSHLSRPGF